MRKYFGTDGVRGIAGSELTPELAFLLGKAGAYVLAEKTKNTHLGKATIIIGKDTRISCDMLEAALVAGITSVGCDVILAGVIPTPGIAFLVSEMNCYCGIVISASHNSYEYNGIKFFNSQGFKLDDEIELSIEKLIEKRKIADEVEGLAIGRVYSKHEECKIAYKKHLTKFFDMDLSGMKIAIDAANGSATEYASSVYQDLGAEVHSIGVEPNGVNINDGVGSTHPKRLAQYVLDQGCHIGFSYDGDADRLIAIDEKGDVVDGDRIMYICAMHMKAKDKLKHNLITATVMSNLGLVLALREENISVGQADVGDRYVLEMMKNTGSVLGGEQSGHIIFLEDNTTGDGIFASLKLMEAVNASNHTLSFLSQKVVIYPQVLVNARVKSKNRTKYDTDVDIVRMITRIEDEMSEKGRVLIRPSGTEPLIRVMIEGEDKKKITDLAVELADLIEKKLG